MLWLLLLLLCVCVTLCACVHVRATQWQVLPYLWRLAADDATLRWRIFVALLLLVGGKVRKGRGSNRAEGAIS